MAKTEKIYLSALETLKKEITSGKYSYNPKLPSESELAAFLKVSGSTVRKVLEQLRKEGLIETRNGSGSFVSEKNLNRIIPVVICNTDPMLRSNKLLQGIKDYLGEMGLISLPTLNKAYPASEREIINDLIKNGHNNMIIFPLSSKSNVFFYQELMRKGINLAFADTLPDSLACDYASCCNFLGGYIATKKLMDLGHKDIAFCCYGKPGNINTLRERFKGYLSAHEQNGLKIDKKNIVFGLDISSDEKTDEFVKSTTATAIFAATDALAFSLFNKFNNSEHKPAIIGFDNSEIAERFSLATINQHQYEIGRAVAELLYKRMLNPNKKYEHIYLPVSIIERESLYNKN